ncbi:hypothetical protein BDF19DRAFT_448502 [Syncephalis fuscata]|nr:hypothetical protein BDF19DRAFT_448502 [Syncephalis fuscata]
MASNVVVSYDNGHRRQPVKTTPMMSLTAIVAMVIKTKVLDMSLTVRFANLPPGASLDLVKQKRSTANAEITIAVQLDDGGRLIRKVPNSITFWEILVQLEVESDGVLNLTRREVAESQPEKSNKMRNWLKKDASTLATATPPPGTFLQPVCMLMNREYATINELKNTSLASVGLTSGNAVIRVSFRPGQQMLADVLASQSISSQKKDTAIDEVFINWTPGLNNDDNNHDSKHSTPTESITSITADSSQLIAPNTDMPDPIADTIDTRQPNDSQANEASPIVASDTKEAPAPSFSNNDADTSPSVSKTIDRMVSVFRAPPPGTSMAHHQIDLPDSFFDAQQAKRAALENSPLQTRTMREAEEEKRKQRYPKTMIRVRFPNRIQLQLQFLSRETVGRVYAIVRQHLLEPQRPFTLYVTPPRQNLTDLSVRLMDAHLAPASLVHFVWNEPGSGNEHYLIESTMTLAKDLPELAVTETAAAESRPEHSSPSTESSTANQSTSSTSARLGSSNSNEANSMKLPKWMKLSKLF